MRQARVLANWKMHGSKAEAKYLLQAAVEQAEAWAGIEVGVLPPFVHLTLAEQYLSGTGIAWGAQNVAIASKGAHSGEVSAEMLKDLGCRYVLVGHSERRNLYGETDAIVAQKFAQVVQAGLIPVLCVGETLAQRQANETFAVLKTQIHAIIESEQGIAGFEQAIIAYEPVWAIGTGLAATPEQAQAVHAHIRSLLASSDSALATRLPILYGGSVKPENAAHLLAMPDVDGGLIGAASLDPQAFKEICGAAKQITDEKRLVCNS